MPTFITETIEESPQVLLIAQSGSFTEAFIHEIQKKHLEVVLIHEDAFLPGNESTLQQISQHYFYKIFWWWGELSQVSNSTSGIIEFLLTRNEPLEIGASVVPPFVSRQPELESWQQIFDLQQRNLLYLQQYLSRASLLFSTSLVGEKEDFLTRLIYAQFSQDTPVLPEVFFLAATRKEVASKLAKLFLQPVNQQQQVLFLGSAFLTSPVVDAFQLHNDRQIQLVPVKQDKAFLAEFIKIQLNTPDGKTQLLTEIGDWKIPEKSQPKIKSTPVSTPTAVPSQNLQPTGTSFQNLPTTFPVPPVWYPELDAQLEKMLKQARPRVVASFPPLIENRLQKFEKIKKQKQLQQSNLAHLPKTNLHQPKTTQLPKKLTEKELKEIDSQLVKIFGEQRQETKASAHQQTVKRVSRIARKQRRQSRFTVILGVTLGLSIFAGLLAGGFFVNRALLEQNLVEFLSTTATPVSEKVESQQRAKLDLTSSIFSVQNQVWQKLFGQEKWKYAVGLTTVSQESLTILNLENEISQLGQTFWQQVIGVDKQNPLQTLALLANKTQAGYQKISAIQTDVQNLADESSSDFKNQLEAFNGKIQDQRKMLAVSQQFEESLPILLGQGTRKTYLVVLQNNLELRPTGGVVEAAALVTFRNGVIANTQLLDVTQLDLSFAGQMTPPVDLQAELGQKNWLLRDANWSADFPSSAQQMMSFVEKTTSQKIDGVFALNLWSFQDLLKATGPVLVPQYQEVVTDQNLLEKVEFHSELAVIPSSTPNYLSILLNQELAQVTTLSPEKTLAMTNAFYTALKENQAFGYVTDPTTETALSSLGWGGGVLNPSCPAQFSQDNQSCVVDSIFQVESNVGVNRANFFVQRTIDEKIQLTSTTISHLRTISYVNTATSNSWPAGNYKNYLRFYLPAAIQNVSVLINDQPVNQQDLFQDASADKEKKIIGFLTTVPVGQQVVVKFQYDEPLSQTAPFSYTFFDQKQSGTPADPIRIEVQADANLRPVYIAPQATVNNNSIAFSGMQDHHLFVGIKFH